MTDMSQRPVDGTSEPNSPPAHSFSPAAFDETLASPDCWHSVLDWHDPICVFDLSCNSFSKKNFKHEQPPTSTKLQLLFTLLSPPTTQKNMQKIAAYISSKI